MPANYVLLGKSVVGSAGAGSVVFSSIPQTGYSDLLIKVSGRTSSTGSQRNATDIVLTFNGSGANYSARILSGNDAVDDPPSVATNAGSSIVWGAETPNADATASVFGNGDIYIVNYASANHKTTVTQNATENNTTNKEIRLAAGLWQDTAAITSITLSTSLVQYSTFYLYGIAKYNTTPVISPFATGGDDIMTDGTYWYHTFKSSGTFTPAKALSVDYLVVAGGGGGGGYDGGGGGAGGFRTNTAFSCASGTGLTVTVGAGGAAGVGGVGTNGSNSVFSTITSAGGGGGSSLGGGNANSGSGGSGGGSNTSSVSGLGNTPSTTPSQGNNGGFASTNNGGGGGGGAGAVGGNSSGNNGGNGGAGTSNSYSGAAVTYAGGGGGGCNGGSPAGTGGAGGGGAGALNNVNGTAATANTGGGGGGGGSGSATNGGAGGSGIVLVRYAV